MDRFLRFSFPLVCSAILLAACGREGGEVDIDPSPVVGSEVFQQAMPTNGEFVHPEHGNEALFAYGAVTGIEGVPASGVANLQVFENGSSVVSVNVNLAQAEEGSAYVAWLRSDAGETLSAGRLETPFRDARHGVTFDTARDLRDFLTVLVTKETTANPSVPGEVVAQGILRVIER